GWDALELEGWDALELEGWARYRDANSLSFGIRWKRPPGCRAMPGAGRCGSFLAGSPAARGAERGVREFVDFSGVSPALR
ncbi:hypothetical protein, partial [uncultured Halomonas sp.]|uniref:hypothetical protein n=1 Tax=uncultured Halomonas sp. TaxID=173971 RepID=UPI0026052BF3